MDHKQKHRREVEAFLGQHFSTGAWNFALPTGSGNETYVAESGDLKLFVKVGARLETAIAMAEAGLSPNVLATGTLDDGSTILVQEYIEGRNPAKADSLPHLEQVASIVQRMHNDKGVKATIAPAPTPTYRAVLRALDELRSLLTLNTPQIPEIATSLHADLDRLEEHAIEITREGLVASHNDICNANWLLTPEGRLYIVDLEAMALDDPARDVGTLLWWYYPPDARPRFLELAGYPNDPDFQHRMRVRTAMHLLLIAFPRPGSFDTFDRVRFDERLRDFRAALVGDENPQGYWLKHPTP